MNTPKASEIIPLTDKTENKSLSRKRHVLVAILCHFCCLHGLRLSEISTAEVRIISKLMLGPRHLSPTKTIASRHLNFVREFFLIP
jgi:hypothetical protein